MVVGKLLLAKAAGSLELLWAQASLACLPLAVVSVRVELVGVREMVARVNKTRVARR